MTSASTLKPHTTLLELMQRLHSDRPDWSDNRRRQQHVAVNKLTQVVGHVPTLQELETKGGRLLTLLKRRMADEGLSRSAIASYRSHLLVLWREAHERSWLRTPPPYAEAGRPVAEFTPRNYREVWALNFRRLRRKKFGHQGEFVRALAEHGLDVRNGMISQWERGMALPSVLVVPTLAKALGCRLSELFPADERGPAAA